MGSQTYPYPTGGILYIPPENLYPDYREYGPYRGFNPMDYCAELRGKVASGELTWEQAHALWREYADSVAAIWVDEPRPGPCSLGGDGDLASTQWSAMPTSPYVDDWFYEDDWIDTWPTTTEQYFDEYLGQFDPSNWLNGSHEEPIVPDSAPMFPPPSIGPPTMGPGTPDTSFSPHEDDDIRVLATVPDGPGGSPGRAWPSRPGMGPHPVATPRPGVLPMYQGEDGVYRDIPVGPRYWGDPAPPDPPPPIELSPYMSLPVSSAYSIKGEGCGCTGCANGDSCK